MNKILLELNEIFQVISSIPVTNDAVDKMAVARAKLRNVYSELKMMSEEVPADGHGT